MERFIGSLNSGLEQDLGEERDRLLYWLDDLAYANLIDTALLFMSLKEPPKALPEGIEAFLIEGSTVRATAMEAA